MKQLPQPRIIVLDQNSIIRRPLPRVRRRKLLSRPLLSSLLACSIAVSACTVSFKPAEIAITVPATATSVMTPAAENPIVASEPTAMQTQEMTGTVMSAALLRVTLDSLLGEHALLAANATDAALHDRQAEFAAATSALDHNSQDIAAAVGLVYGQAAGDAFLQLWRKHITFFVDYTKAVAAKDEGARTQALDHLTAYAQDFGAFLASANPELTISVVKELLGPHVATLTAVIDAQAQDDYPAAYRHLREAYAHMDMIAKALAGAIALQFPERFPGSGDTMGDNLRSVLNQLLAEHVALAADATNAALAGRSEQFDAAADALDGNSMDLAMSIGAVYGKEAGDAFLPLWRKHIGFFVDYTNAVAKQDDVGRNKALNDLTAYAEDFAAFLVSANPNLTVEGVKGLLAPHVQTLTAVIDAQAAGQADEAFTQLRIAYQHMNMIANPLSDAIIAQFPDAFPEEKGGILADNYGEMDSSMAMTSTMHLYDTMEMSDTMTMSSTMTMSDTMEMHETMPMMEANDITDTMEMSAPLEMGAMESQIVMSAAELRATLDLLLGEHVALAASATDAALRGRSAEFDAAANALDANSVDIAGAIGLVYGKDAETAFLPLWRKHIGFFVDYTNGVAQADEKARQQALNNLDAYAEDFGAFIESANPNLPKAAVAELLRQHVATLTAVIDAQVAKTAQESGDQMSAYPALRTAFAHMDMEASALAGAIAQQFPERFPGKIDSAAAGLRSALTQLLSEHALLLIKAIDAATHARTIEYEAAFAALDANSVALAKAIGSVYGEKAGTAFQGLWRKHIGFFIDYSLALIGKNDAAKEKAASELTQYAQDFAAFLHSANPDLPADVVSGLVSEHAKTTLAAIDASASDDVAAYYTALRSAYSHMSMIANGLSDAVIAQFPDKFGDGEADVESTSAMNQMEGMSHTMTLSDTMAMSDTMTMSDTMNAATTETLAFDIAISTFSFKPGRLEVPLGATVVWTNMDAINHTVTSGEPGALTGDFDSGNFGQGESFSVTFEAPGEYPYFCGRHNGMRGVIVVKE